MQFIKQSRDKKKLLENIEKNKKFHSVSNLSATLINEATGLNLKINKEQEKIDMCQAMKEIIEDIRNEERTKLKLEKEKTKAEKAKNKAALLKIKELEKMVKNLQAQLKTA